MLAECGATGPWANFNASLGSEILREAAAIAGDASTGQVLPTGSPGTTSLAVRKPLGSVLAIAPWNAPVILGVRAVAAALACGNSVIFKGSEQCPRVHAIIASSLHAAGAPAGVVQYVLHRPEDAAVVTERPVSHPGIAHVNFTGSTRVGRVIAETAAKTLTPTLLELGGKAPAVVLDDADLDCAVDAIGFGAYMNAGQICMSTERVIVHRSLHEEFVSRLVRRAEALTVGDPANPRTQVGPLVGASSRERVLSLLADAQIKGADVTAGGEAEGNLLSPTVVTGVTRGMAIYREETFAPVVIVLPFDDDDEAVTLANDSEYGLSSAVFGSDESRAMRVASRIDAGLIHVNSATVDDEPNVPFGGVKGSGWGRFGGGYAIEEFTQLQWLTLQRGERHYPI